MMMTVAAIADMPFVRRKEEIRFWCKLGYQIKNLDNPVLPGGVDLSL